MKRKMFALMMLGVAARADAGAVLELVPDQAGPYSPGQAVGVEVWMHNEEAFAIDLRLVILDFQGLRQRLFAGGDFVTSGGVTVNHVAKFTGGSWTAIDQGMEGSVYSLQACTLNGGTTLYAGGYVYPGMGDWDAVVHRMEAGWWTEIGRAPSNRVLSLACWNDGTGSKLYAGGFIDDMAEVSLYGITNWDGVEWSAMQDLNWAVMDMVVPR